MARSPQYIAAALSLCLPGLGQLYLQRWLTSAGFFAPFLFLFFIDGKFLWFPLLSIASSWEAFRNGAEKTRQVRRILWPVQSLYVALSMVGLFAWTGQGLNHFYGVGPRLNLSYRADLIADKIRACTLLLGRHPATISECPGLGELVGDHSEVEFGIETFQVSFHHRTGPTLFRYRYDLRGGGKP